MTRTDDIERLTKWLDEKAAGGNPAFPTGCDLPGGGKIRFSGMSLREWYAGLAMQGILSNSGEAVGIHQATVENTARAAFAFADAMLKKREER